ncbi:FAD binding domain-containing protein [Bartonella apihabitans]|nr:FAD-binding oxidoreductase [Bartonella apihabitans]AQT44142.1 FAD binding domain-containing protein [Bartonella apihabitans]
MTKLLQPEPTLSQHYQAFLEQLKQSSFKGDIGTSYGERIVMATDNSIYQRMPQAIVYPRNKRDVKTIMHLAGDAKWRDIVLAPRGGGTGTNGQSLSDGIIVDLSRHMNAILEINVAERWVRVETGVVKDQLNAKLKNMAYFCSGTFDIQSCHYWRHD